MAKPKSAISFHRRFRSEEACIAYLEAVRWNGEPVCPRCGCVRCYRVRTQQRYKCAGCRRTFTVRHGTIFEDSKLPLLTWFSAVWLVTTARAGISSVELGEKLGIRQKSAWFVLHRIQHVAGYGIDNGPLSGQVEMDDFEPFKRDGGKKTSVVGIVQRQGEVRMEVANKLDIRATRGLLEKHVNRDATLMTDGWWSYDSAAAELRMEHRTVTHSKGEYAKPDGTHTNTVEGMFGNFARRLKGVHIHVSAKHLQKYCDAHAYRYNAADLEPMERFENWFHSIFTRLTYKALTA